MVGRNKWRTCKHLVIGIDGYMMLSFVGSIVKSKTGEGESGKTGNYAFSLAGKKEIGEEDLKQGE